MKFARAFCFSLLAVASAMADSARLQVFISDLHFGVGKDPATGKWSNLEDARWAPEFSSFLQHIDAIGEGATDLVLNGDTFELWQSTEQDCIYPNRASQDANLGCTEKDSLRRLEKVVSAHKAELDRIAKFGASAGNRVVFVPGNHDVAILYPSVAARVMQAVGHANGHAGIASKGYWLSDDGMLYAEHGHQIGEELNRFADWPKPFLERGGVRYLQRPWGEQFVQRFYNDFEIKYPIIDNFTTDADGVRFGLATEGWGGSPVAVGKLIRFLLLQVSPSQFARSLGGDAGHPAWDVAKVRKLGDRFLVESLPAGDPLRDLVEKAGAERTLAVSVAEFSDEEISGICDRRVGMEGVEPCPALTQGAGLEKAIPRDRIFTKHLDATWQALADAGATKQRFRYFIMSHTHNADAGFDPLAKSGRPWQPTVVNTGAWQRTVSPKQMAAIMQQRKIATKAQALTTIRLEDLPPCYDVVIVRPYTGIPKAELKGWQPGLAGEWSLGPACR